MEVFSIKQRIQTAVSEQNLVVWAAQVDACRNSGLSVKEWCSENGIHPNTYFRRQRKVFDAMFQDQEAETFYEVPMPKTSSIAATVKVNGIAAEIYNNAEAVTVQAIIQAIRAC